MHVSSYLPALAALRDSVPTDQRGLFDDQLHRTQKNPVVIFGSSLWLGWTGIDRLLVGHIWKGLLKMFLGIAFMAMDTGQYGRTSLVSTFYDAYPLLYLMALAGLIWIIIDIFRIAGIARGVSYMEIRKFTRGLNAAA